MTRPHRRLETRSRILGIAREHLLAHGWRATRVQAIAAQAGISRPTFYKEFPSKRDLGLALVRAESERFIGALGRELLLADTPREGVRRGVAFALEQGATNPLLAVVLTEDADSDGSLITTITVGPDTIVPVAARAAAKLMEVVRPDVPRERIAFACDCVARLTFSHVLLPGGYDHAALAEQIADVAMGILDGPAD